MTSAKHTVPGLQYGANSGLRICQREDVLLAFLAVAKEIRSRCQCFDQRAMTQREACELSGRIKEQRNLLRLLVGEKQQRERLKKLLHLNRQLRNKVVAFAQEANLDTSAMMLK